MQLPAFKPPFPSNFSLSSVKVIGIAITCT